MIFQDVSYNLTKNFPLDYKNDIYKRTNEIINKFNSKNFESYNSYDKNDIENKTLVLNDKRNLEYHRINFLSTDNLYSNNYNSKKEYSYPKLYKDNLNYSIKNIYNEKYLQNILTKNNNKIDLNNNTKNSTVLTSLQNYNDNNINNINYNEIKNNNIDTIDNILNGNYITSLNEISLIPEKEQINLLFSNNLKLQNELSHLKKENKILRNELHNLNLNYNTKNNNDFKNYILEENDKLNKLNKINNFIVNNLIKKVNSLSKNETNLISYSDLINHPEKIIKINDNSNHKEINIEENLKSKPKKSKSNIINDSQKKNLRTLKKKKIKSKIIKKNLSLNNIKLDNDNKDDFMNYYKKNEKDRIKTCYACLFGNNKNKKGI